MSTVGGVSASRASAIAEEQRREAARQAALAARRAEAARERARRALEAARARQREAVAARQRAQQAEQRLEAQRATARAAGPAERVGQARRLRAAETEAAREGQRARELEAVAHRAREDAQRIAGEALGAQQSANGRAEIAGRRPAFALASRVDDVYDAGSLSRRDQTELFGAPLGLSPEEAAAADVRKVEEAAERGPEQAAHALEHQLAENRDPDYRRALVRGSGQAVEAIGRRLAEEDGIGEGAAARTVASLSRSAELAGPDGGAELADRFARHLPENLAVRHGPRLASALREASSEPAGAGFGAQVAERLAATGRYDAAVQIAELSPELGRGTEIDHGAARVQAQIRVDEGDARLEREILAADREEVDRQARARVDAVFARAEGGELPRGVEATVSGDRAELVRRDAAGRVREREVAIRTDDGEVHYQRTHYRDGEARRSTLESGPGGTAARHERWREEASATPANPDREDLARRAAAGEAGVELAEQRVAFDGDTLVHTEERFGAEGREHIERRHRFGDADLDGMPGALAEELGDGRGVEVVDTRRTAERWGEDAETSSERQISRGNVRVTSLDAGEDAPRSWTLERQACNEYRSQVFVEGAPDATQVVTRRAEGRTLTEEISARGKDEDGDDYETSGSATTTWDAEGRVVHKVAEGVDAEGVRTAQAYERTEERTRRGLEVTDRYRTTRTEPGEPPQTFGQDRELRTLERDGAAQLLSVRERLSQPRPGGGLDVAESVIDGQGLRLTVNDRPIPVAERSAELDRLSVGEKELAVQAAADTVGEVRKLVSQGKNAVDLLRVGAGVGPGAYDSRLPPATRVLVDQRLDQLRGRLDQRFGQAQVERAFGLQHQVSTGAKGLIGIGAVVSSGLSLAANIQEGNVLRIGLDVGGISAGGAATVAAGRELRALRAGAGPEAVSKAAGKFGTFAKVGGLGVAVGANGYNLVDGIVKKDGVQIAQGGVGLAGTVAAFGVGGAIGGPPGVLVGVGIGVLTFGAQWGIGKLFDGGPEIADKEI